MTRFADGALELATDGEVATLRLARPDKRNAFSQAMWLALGDIAATVAADPRVKLLVVTGAGAHFSAGADISEFEQIYASRESARIYARAAYDGVEAIARLEKPTIAQISGVCVGGGVALALACDLRLAARDARLGVTPSRLGILYNLADTKRLVEAVGPSAAKDILFTGRIMVADEANAIGLVDAVYPPDGLAAAVIDKASTICGGSQWTVRRAKAVIGMILKGAVDDDQVTRDWFLDAVEGEDFKEGRAAFMAKRPPHFTYR